MLEKLQEECLGGSSEASREKYLTESWIGIPAGMPSEIDGNMAGRISGETPDGIPGGIPGEIIERIPAEFVKGIEIVFLR